MFSKKAVQQRQLSAQFSGVSLCPSFHSNRIE